MHSALPGQAEYPDQQPVLGDPAPLREPLSDFLTSRFAPGSPKWGQG